MKKADSKLLLKGNSNKHVINGKIMFNEEHKGDFQKITVLNEAVLKHETPNGNFAEHHSLKIEKGEWVQGVQIEFNPFKRTIGQIWD